MTSPRKNLLTKQKNFFNIELQDLPNAQSVWTAL